MAYPIRFKLVHKETGKTFKQWAKDTGKSRNDKCGLMPFVNEQGNIGLVDFEGFYLGHDFLSCSDWALYVAVNKDEKGQWVYQQVGH